MATRLACITQYSHRDLSLLLPLYPAIQDTHDLALEFARRRLTILENTIMNKHKITIEDDIITVRIYER